MYITMNFRRKKHISNQTKALRKQKKYISFIRKPAVSEVAYQKKPDKLYSKRNRNKTN